MTRSVTLDELDRRLIHALQIDGRASFSRIASVLGAPERTVARRYHRLRSELVVRVVGLVDSRRIGMLDWFVRMTARPMPPTRWPLPSPSATTPRGSPRSPAGRA
ncbi:AsnC family protein [Streptomyces sp. NPDC060334]|uniref:Lrp/AsnC family transcriptional regulator n=1 Tax=unclassified Streptomyces TaxID=2593676 RepID=UPI003325BF3A